MMTGLWVANVMYYFIHPRLLLQAYKCLKERGAQTSYFSSSNDIWRCHLPKPRSLRGTLWEEMWRKAGGRQQDWKSSIFLFLTRFCPPTVSGMKSVRCFIMHTPLKCNLHIMLYLSLLKSSISLSPIKTYLFSFNQFQVFLLPSQNCSPFKSLYSWSSWKDIFSVKMDFWPYYFTPKLRKLILPLSWYYFPTVSFTHDIHTGVSCYSLGIQSIFHSSL